MAFDSYRYRDPLEVLLRDEHGVRHCYHRLHERREAVKPMRRQKRGMD
jgi:hypothetical protein